MRVERRYGIGAGICLLGSLAGCTAEIPPAHVGIKFNANSGISQKLERPQVVWMKWGDRVISYPTAIRNATFVRNVHEGQRSRDDSIRCSTIEGAILPVDVTVAYHVAQENVITAFRSFGGADSGEIQSEFLRWVTVYGMNSVSGQRSIFDLLSRDRAHFGGQVKDIIAPITIEWGLTIDDVYIGEVYPPPAVREKVQERITVRNELELAGLRLRKARIDSQTILTDARRDAETNLLLGKQGKTAIDLKRLKLRTDAIEKWDGRAPLVGDGAVPFTDIRVR